MPKLKRPIVREDEELDSSEVFLEDAEELPQQIQDLITQEGAGDYKIVVVRKPPNSNKSETIPETYYGTNEFDPAGIAREYGGGQYTFTLLRPNGRFLKRWTTNYASKKIENAVAPAQREIVQARDENAKQIIEILKTQMESTREESKNAMTQMFNTMTAMFGAMKSAPPPTPPPQTDPLDILVKYKQLFPEREIPDNGGDNTARILEAIKLGQQLVSASKGDGSPIEEKIIMKLADLVVPMLEQNMKGGNNPMRRKMPAGQIKVNNAPVPDNGAPLEVVESNDERMLKFIGQNLKAFMNMAQNNSPVECVSEYLYQSLDEKDFDDLIAFLETGGQEKILARYPELLAHKKWVSALIEDLCNLPEAPPAEQAVVKSPSDIEGEIKDE